MNLCHVKDSVLCLAAAAALFCFPAAAGAQAKASYQYDLSDFSGTVRYGWVRPVVDAERNEIYVLAGNAVSVFNESGMEVFRFGDDLDLGLLVDVAVEPDGNILLLSRVNDRFTVTRCNFRGEPRAEIVVRDLPGDFAGFSPTRLVYRDGTLYLADLFAKKVAVTDADGAFRNGFDIAPMLADFEMKPGSQSNMSGFTVDGKGNLFFTVPAIFKAFRLSPDGTLSAFGDAGNLPGKFNIVAGITTDESGYIYVTDSLRCAVTIFDGDFKFQAQFSQRGLEPGSLIAPKELVVDKKGRVYVSQARNRGISVFQVTHD